MGEAQAGPPQVDPHGHDYSAHYRSPEGYGVCCNCGARENTDRSARPCVRALRARLVTLLSRLGSVGDGLVCIWCHSSVHYLGCELAALLKELKG